jgi:transposase
VTTQLLAKLVARRRQIVEMIAAESQRARHISVPRLKKSIARLRKALERNCPNWTTISPTTSGACRPGPRRKTCSPDHLEPLTQSLASSVGRMSSHRGYWVPAL